MKHHFQQIKELRTIQMLPLGIIHNATYVSHVLHPRALKPNPSHVSKQSCAKEPSQLATGCLSSCLLRMNGSEPWNQVSVVWTFRFEVLSMTWMEWSRAVICSVTNAGRLKSVVSVVFPTFLLRRSCESPTACASRNVCGLSWVAVRDRGWLRSRC